MYELSAEVTATFREKNASFFQWRFREIRKRKISRVCEPKTTKKKTKKNSTSQRNKKKGGGGCVGGDGCLGRRSPSVSGHRRRCTAQTGPSARREEWPKLAGTFLSHGGKSQRQPGHPPLPPPPNPPVAALAISL